MGYPRVADDVLLHEDHGEAFLLHVASGRYFGLNPTGLVIWRALAAGEDPVAALRICWPATDEATCREDTRRLMASLSSAGLVQADAPRASA